MAGEQLKRGRRLENAKHCYDATIRASETRVGGHCMSFPSGSQSGLKCRKCGATYQADFSEDDDGRRFVSSVSNEKGLYLGGSLKKTGGRVYSAADTYCPACTRGMDK